MTTQLSVSEQMSAAQPTRRVSRWRTIFVRGLAATAFVVVVDLSSRALLNTFENPAGWLGIDYLVYGLGVVWSLAWWTSVADLVMARTATARRTRWRFVGMFAAFVGGAMLVASVVYRAHLGTSPSWHALAFAAGKSGHTVELLRQWVSIWTPLAVVGAALILWWIFRYRAAPAVSGGASGISSGETRRRRWLRWGILSSGFFGISALSLFTPGMQSPLPLDTNAAAAIAQYGLGQFTDKRHLVVPLRQAIPPQPRREHPNVLLLVHESLSAHEVFPGLPHVPQSRDAVGARTLSPFGATLPERRDEGYFTFPWARTNSTATESSVPTILSGVYLGGETLAYTHAPSVWSLGDAAGAKTFLFSSCDYNWGHFDEYFLDAHVHVAETGKALSPVIVNDTGIDDGIVVDAAIEHIANLAKSGDRFVGVVHFNATHGPGFSGSARDGGETRLPGREGAVQYVDELNARIMRALDTLGIADNTVVLATSDHGEQPRPGRAPDRLGNFYDAVVRIPVWAHVPPQVLAQHPDWAENLGEWTGRNVQNIDILPTIRDVLGLGQVAELQAPLLSGSSLVSGAPAAQDRVITGQSTCAFREWNLDGFYAVRGKTKVLVTNSSTTPEIYDLASDPTEQNNLWADDDARAQTLPWLLETVSAGPELAAACRRAGAACPLE